MASNKSPITQVLLSFRPYDNADKDFHLHHPLATSLVGPKAHLTSGYADRFQDALDPILEKHYAECLSACPKQCIDCGAPTTKAFQIPTSSLNHSLETDGREPSVQVMVLPLCDKTICAKNATANFQIMQQRALASQNRAKEGACDVCGKMEETKKCAGCKQLSYCGRECQKKAWKSHKKVCGKSVQDMGKE